MKFNPVSDISPSFSLFCVRLRRSISRSIPRPILRSIGCAAATTLLLSVSFPAAADTRIIGEFEYSVDDNEMREWEVGSAFLLYESADSELDLEILVGQDETLWFIQPELIYETDFDDFNLEFSVGLEAPFNGEPIESFGSIEGSLDF